MRRPTRRPCASGGRDDCWSDDATSALITAWGDRYLGLNRGSLRHKDWSDVAAAVNSRRHSAAVYKSDGQCKNRIDTLKKKFKLEKSKPFSSWVFFETLDSLIGAGAAVPSSSKRAESGDDDVAEEEGVGLEGGDGCRELARVIAKFGESYERMERLKMEQEVELEKQRMKFMKELEVERLNMFMDAQLEMEKKKKRGEYSHHRRSHSGKKL